MSESVNNPGSREPHPPEIPAPNMAVGDVSPQIQAAEHEAESLALDVQRVKEEIAEHGEDETLLAELDRAEILAAQAEIDRIRWLEAAGIEEEGMGLKKELAQETLIEKAQQTFSLEDRDKKRNIPRDTTRRPPT